ncbi:ribosomal L27 protein-domain-containing protein [Geopyxis carbonaria]|nr:ribosomal L27 protein-domain-containing protein [Geopyxis carbonaria]
MLPRLVCALRSLTVSITPSSIPRQAFRTFSIARTTAPRISLPRSSIAVNAQQTRQASHATSGRANKAKDGPGKRLGAKKTQGEKVIPGMIIYRQRGTVWYPGENAGMGRDHTIFAAQPGYVRYYKDPKHPKRQFIGIALREDQKLPHPDGAARVRRLEHVQVPLVEDPPSVPFGTPLTKADLESKDGFYVFRPPNWKIGRIMPQVRIKNNNPFARWQKKGKRAENYRKRKGIS